MLTKLLLNERKLSEMQLMNALSPMVNLSHSTNVTLVIELHPEKLDAPILVMLLPNDIDVKDVHPENAWSSMVSIDVGNSNDESSGQSPNAILPIVLRLVFDSNVIVVSILLDANVFVLIV